MRGGNTRHTRNIRCVHGQADAYNTGAVPVRRAVAGPVRGRRRAERREARRADGPRIRDACPALDDRARGPLAAAAGRHAAPRPHQPVLPRRRQGPGQHVPPDRRSGWGSRSATAPTVERPGRWTATECTGGQRRHDGDAGADPAPGRSCARAAGSRPTSSGCARYWGDAADNYHHPRPAYNDGRVLRRAVRRRAPQRAGEERGFHAVAVDARSPRFDGGIATRLDSIPFGIVVNRDGRRFYDEGEDIWPKRYAIWGRNIAEQPGQIAYRSGTPRSAACSCRRCTGPHRAGDDRASSRRSSASTPATLADTVTRVQRGDRARRPRSTRPRWTAARTRGLDPPKSNWAQPIDTPPYYGDADAAGHHLHLHGRRGRPSRPGCCAKDGDARSRNVFAAGEIMSGNILSTGYLAGVRA